MRQKGRTVAVVSHVRHVESATLRGGEHPQHVKVYEGQELLVASFFNTLWLVPLTRATTPGIIQRGGPSGRQMDNVQPPRLDAFMNGSRVCTRDTFRRNSVCIGPPFLCCEKRTGTAVYTSQTAGWRCKILQAVNPHESSTSSHH